MMSCQVDNDVKMTTARISGPSKRMVERENGSVQAAITGRIRPRRETAGVRGTHGDPDLLERAPVVGGAQVTQQPAAVRLLEGEIHLEAAPVGAAGIHPASLVAVDAHPVPELGRVLRVPPRRVRSMSPAPCEVAKLCCRRAR